MTSKAWRAILPNNLREDQLAGLERWAKDNCALHRILSDHGRTIMLGLDARPRTAASFSRTLRSLFKRRAMDTRSLQGHWLRLSTVREVLLAVGDDAGSGLAFSSGVTQGKQTLPNEADERVIQLY